MTASLIKAGNTALITGGASGIGFGTAQVFLKSGLNVVVTDVRREHLASARVALAGFEERTLFLELDVAAIEQWRRARLAVEDRFGRLHILFLNAGVGILGSMLDTSPADYDWITAVNLSGVINGVQAFLPHMRAHGEPGQIVATSSMGGLIVANDGGVYSSAKFGVVALMEELRRDLAGSNISASVLCPAAVNTNIFEHERIRPGAGGRDEQLEDEQALAQREAAAKEILSLGRTPLEVGQMVEQSVACDDPYVFTDRNVAPSLLARRDALLSFT